MEMNYIQAYNRKYFEFYLLNNKVINDVLVNYNITLSSFKLFAVIIVKFPKSKQIFTVRKLKELGVFAKTFNYNRALSELLKAELIRATELGFQNVYWISDKGHWLPVHIECKLLELK